MNLERIIKEAVKESLVKESGNLTDDYKCSKCGADLTSECSIGEDAKISVRRCFHWDPKEDWVVQDGKDELDESDEEDYYHFCLNCDEEISL